MAERGECLPEAYRVSLQADENVSEPGTGDGYTIQRVYRGCTFKRSVLYEFYFS